MTRWLAAAIGTASVVLTVWTIEFLMRSYEPLQIEYAIPALLLALVGAMTAVVAWRRG